MADALVDRLDRAIDAVVGRRDATAALQDPELAPLVRLAADLRHCPGADFKARLRAQLLRRNTMSAAVLESAVREGFSTVTPYLWVPDRGLADFLIRVFGAVETRAAEGGRHGTHRELRIGGSMLMIGEDPQLPAAGRAMAFHVFVNEVDTVFAQALAAGGESMGEPADRPYGERSGFVKDAYGNHWYIATPLGPDSLAQAVGTLTPYLLTQDVRGYLDFLARAFGAVEEMVHEEPGGFVPYARARIGDAALEFGTREALPGAFCLYVADPDAVYEQAIAAGAKPLAAPADQPAGDRMASVEDPVGNHWYITRPAAQA